MNISGIKRRLRERGWKTYLGGPWLIAPWDWSNECDCPIGCPRLWLPVQAHREQHVRDMTEKNGFDRDAHNLREDFKESFGWNYKAAKL